MTATAFIVDAFTEAPFSGNPAAVCLLDGDSGDRWLQAVAALPPVRRAVMARLLEPHLLPRNERS